MIREIIKPQQNQIILSIPQSYINKEIELLVFPLDINGVGKHKIKKKKSLKGVFNKYANNSKISLENKAWQDHIVNKFKND